MLTVANVFAQTQPSGVVKDVTLWAADLIKAQGCVLQL